MDDEVYPMVRRYWQGLLDAHSGGAESQRRWIDETLAAVRAGKVYSGYKSPQQKAPRSGFDDLDDKIPF